MNETYSVVIPAYNAAETISRCLDSVLNQSLRPAQALVVDDASTDGTSTIVLAYQSRFASEGIDFRCLRLDRNGGPSAARNLGVREATGTFVAFLDADDIWSRCKLSVVDRFAFESGANLLCHAYRDAKQLPSAETAGLYRGAPWSRWRILLRNPAQTSCAVVRRAPGIAFDEAMRYHEDHDLWVRIAEEGRVLRIFGPPLTTLGRPQLSMGGLSGNVTGMRLGEFLVYRKFCLRAPWTRIWLLPILIAFSVSKHVYSWLKRFRKCSANTYNQAD